MDESDLNPSTLSPAGQQTALLQTVRDRRDARDLEFRRARRLSDRAITSRYERSAGRNGPSRASTNSIRRADNGADAVSVHGPSPSRARIPARRAPETNSRSNPISPALRP